MTTELMTNFKQEFREALEGGADYDVLRRLIERYYSAGGTKSQAYDAIQHIWLGYGFDDDPHDDENPVRDMLEFTMERVWYWDD